MTDHEDGGATALAGRLMGLLAAVAAWSDEALGPGLAQALGQLPGVDAAALLPAGLPPRGAPFRDFGLVAGGSSHGALSLRVTDARAFAAWEALLPPFCAALAQLLEGRRLSRVAQQLQERTLELRHSEKRFRDLFDNSPDPCWLIEHGVFTDCNHAAVSLLGYTQRDEILQHPSRLSPEFQPDGRPSYEKAEEMMQQAMKQGVARFEWVHCRADGSRFPVEVTLARLDLQGHEALYCVWRDITDRKKAEEEAYSLAFFDPLTGLPNRRLLLDRLQQSMAASSRSGKYRAVLYLDLDHFKNLNDTQGHEVGDRLLVETARRLSACVREGDTVARLGGDEFVVLIQQLDEDLETAVSQADMVGSKIVARLAEPCDLGPVVHQGTASVGITLFLGQGVPIDELLKRADLAMYQAKAGGRNTLRFFDPAIQARIAARALMETELRHAVPRRELVLHYQPQVDPQGRCVGVEALIRWNNPNRGRVPPLDFIPLAEETGLILPIGHWVLGEACRTLRAWQADPLTAQLSIAVNVSMRQFREARFVSEIQAHLRATGIDPARLKLEITESMLVDNIEQTIATMQALKGMGVTFSLDDFGTGYSSLYYVKRLPLDQIKIDQSFVRDILVDPNDAAICRAVIALGHSLGLVTIAEGVETERQWAVLAGERCDAAQGYLYARPMPEADLVQWLRQRA
ncbi:putative bifunctional diguanylate cyclase/phosphodiesterase [Simplicispira lacusdiani]|uniref:putative bifunctional diguanylate cyclase/phosphodiesterase n=1 Tax=Simplicispira lacusdiani TaxID=2213010 RepID=UPI00130040B4|nr:EAL domain-containing protein [Simplicispira lacusdiani]